MSASILHLAINMEGGESGAAVGIDATSIGSTPLCDFIRIGFDLDNLDASRRFGRELVDLFAPRFIGSGHTILAESDRAIIVGRGDPKDREYLSLFHDDFPSLVFGDSLEGSPLRAAAERASIPARST